MPVNFTLRYADSRVLIRIMFSKIISMKNFDDMFVLDYATGKEKITVQNVSVYNRIIYS